MIFHEIYSAYYNAVASILSSLVKEGGTQKDLKDAVARHAFGESALSILPALREGRWPLMREDLSTPLVHAPTMPLTLLEKRWLKSVASDKRVRLFDLQLDGLEDVDPLFTEEDYFVFDKYADGDPYESEEYIAHFRLILRAIREGLPLEVEMVNRNGRALVRRFVPTRLEYSEKDDKFRVYTGTSHAGVINLAKITRCHLCRVPITPPVEPASSIGQVTLEVYDERNALERVMLHFAHFEKRAEEIGKGHYRLTVIYDKSDEAELVIRVLSFGLLVRVTEPESFVELIREKLKKQQSCGLK